MPAEETLRQPSPLRDVETKVSGGAHEEPLEYKTAEEELKAQFIVGDLGDVHEVGNIDCGLCWTEHPLRCECSGLIHTAFGDESRDGDYWLYKKCDKCGDEYSEV